ncbi:MAG: DUF2726 domain-containing protein [Bacteroidales bacterium]|nr:DUF2726 domain-containing protein [Bacteroidales bacterium]
MLSQEEILNYVKAENWNQVLLLIKEHINDIRSDILLSHSVGIFIKQFFEKMDEYPIQRHDITENLITIWYLHTGNIYTLPYSKLETLIIQIVKRKRQNLKEAYDYAKHLPNNKLCAEVIAEYEGQKLSTKSKKGSKKSEKNNKSKEMKKNTGLIKQLFKTDYEKNMFHILKSTFDSFQVFPDIPICELFEWENIKKKLSFPEQDYFFKGRIKFVVFDRFTDYTPIYFIEQESSIIKNLEDLRKDKLKSEIVKKAGKILLRINKLEDYKNQKDFADQIRLQIDRLH